MPQFRIINAKTSADLGVFSGENARAALDAMAQDAGYANHEAACEVTPVAPGELRILEITGATVYDYETGDRLGGTASPKLIDESIRRDARGGACAAYQGSDGVWYFVADADVEHYDRNLGVPSTSVYVLTEESVCADPLG